MPELLFWYYSGIAILELAHTINGCHFLISIFLVSCVFVKVNFLQCQKKKFLGFSFFDLLENWTLPLLKIQ
jgi:hypothetical protein